MNPVKTNLQKLKRKMKFLQEIEQERVTPRPTAATTHTPLPAYCSRTSGAVACALDAPCRELVSWSARLHIKRGRDDVSEGTRAPLPSRWSSPSTKTNRWYALCANGAARRAN